MDTIARFIDGIKIYIFNAVDVKMKFNFSYAYNSASSKNALDFFKKFEMVYPIKDQINTVQTDNGSEFMGNFHQYLVIRNIKHLFSYPRCPKINAFVERANRTIRSEFVDANIQYALVDLHLFNRKLIDYLVWFNCKRVHKSLGNITPIDYLIKNLPNESHMYVTYTKPRIYLFFRL